MIFHDTRIGEVPLFLRVAHFMEFWVTTVRESELLAPWRQSDALSSGGLLGPKSPCVWFGSLYRVRASTETKVCICSEFGSN